MNKLQTTDKKQNVQQIIPVLQENCNEVLTSVLGKNSLLFKGEKNEFYPYKQDGITYFFVGLGENPSLIDLKNTAKKFSWTFREKLETEDAQLHLPASFDAKEIRNFCLGLFNGTYQIIQGRESFSHPLWNKELTLYVSQEDAGQELQEIVEEARIIVEGQFMAMDVLNLPPNKKNSEILAEFISGLAENQNFSCKILDKEKCIDEGLHAFLSVNQGSAYEPAFIQLEYKPENPVKKVGWVGKCVTFDTGGISIKPSQNMHYMKSDMGGATTVLGAFLSVVNLELPIHLVAILPATDNAVDNTAYLPGDVINSHAGKTIEIINTDAEGRMTLADGLSYMHENHAPDVMMDLATLTGSVVRTFGYKCAGMFTENEELAKRITKIGNDIGEKVWQLPLWDEYLEDLKSDVADLKHISNTPLSDVIYAAKFLQQFTHGHKEWMHLDIAGVAFGNNAYSKDKSATGYGVQLLVELMESFVS